MLAGRLLFMTVSRYVSENGRYFNIVSKNIVNGKKDMIIKKAVCAEKEGT